MVLTDIIELVWIINWQNSNVLTSIKEFSFHLYSERYQFLSFLNIKYLGFVFDNANHCSDSENPAVLHISPSIDISALHSFFGLESQYDAFLALNKQKVPLAKCKMILVQGLSIVFEKIKLLLYFCHYIWYQIRDLQEPMHLTNLSISPNQLTLMIIHNSSNNAVDHYPSLKTSYCLLIMLFSLLVPVIFKH